MPASTRGFTLVELLVVLALLALTFALIVPNIGALVPSARLSASGKQILRELDWVRSEARIQGKRMGIEFDLERGIWRIVYPPEQQLTRDQDASALEERPDQWIELETDVVFAGAGDDKAGMTRKGVYRLQFDEYGFTGDQVLVLQLKSNPDMVWSLKISGLSGRVEVEESETGEVHYPVETGEGAF
ncbi:MAG: prepilin-type N-terminal cleavage/methylation domain-containing protein [Planctomycetes bacterium]|nr:prepilin-type N-terminal cleavage/methylation domain-containing protein [Planctomycetota bacterium]